jgi:epoxyqueuosine reductase QueG
VEGINRETFLNSQIESNLIKEGASLVGFADISDLPAANRDSMNFAVSIAVALDASVIKGISNGPTLDYYQEYNRVNLLLSNLCKIVAEFLRKKDHTAVIIEPTVKELDFKTLSAKFQHKTAATRAGLGWIGKSALLVTEKYGSAVRLATVLTDAEFEVGEPIDNSRCGTCDRCVERCPALAIVGRNWTVGLDRGMMLDAFKCCDNAKKMSKDIGISATICGICINACPWTQKYISREIT